MLNNLKNLFFPHERNNYKPRVLHLSALLTLILVLFVFQASISLYNRVQPGVLGYASDISVADIVTQTNKQRAREGLESLKYDASLSEAAKNKAADMFANNYWSHYSPGGTAPWYFFKTIGYNYLYAGENLARDFSESSGVVEAWMNSASHRENLLNSHYQDIGVAVVNGTLNGEETTLVVQLFGTRGGTAAITKEPALDQPVELVSRTKVEGVASSLSLKKSVGTGILLVLLIALFIDGFIAWKYNIIRVSGKSMIHFSFLAVILITVLIIESGKII